MSETKTKITKKYIVRWPFDDYKAGDEFIPEGGKNDETIIEHLCDIVYNEIEPVKKKPARRKTGRKNG